MQHPINSKDAKKLIELVLPINMGGLWEATKAIQKLDKQTSQNICITALKAAASSDHLETLSAKSKEKVLKEVSLFFLSKLWQQVVLNNAQQAAEVLKKTCPQSNRKDINRNWKMVLVQIKQSELSKEGDSLIWEYIYDQLLLKKIPKKEIKLLVLAIVFLSKKNDVEQFLEQVKAKLEDSSESLEKYFKLTVLEAAAKYGHLQLIENYAYEPTNWLPGIWKRILQNRHAEIARAFFENYDSSSLNLLLEINEGDHQMAEMIVDEYPDQLKSVFNGFNLLAHAIKIGKSGLAIFLLSSKNKHVVEQLPKLMTFTKEDEKTKEFFTIFSLALDLKDKDLNVLLVKIRLGQIKAMKNHAKGLEELIKTFGLIPLNNTSLQQEALKIFEELQKEFFRETVVIRIKIFVEELLRTKKPLNSLEIIATSLFEKSLPDEDVISADEFFVEAEKFFDLALNLKNKLFIEKTIGKLERLILRLRTRKRRLSEAAQMCRKVADMCRNINELIHQDKDSAKNPKPQEEFKYLTLLSEYFTVLCKMIVKQPADKLQDNEETIAEHNEAMIQAMELDDDSLIEATMLAFEKVPETIVDAEEKLFRFAQILEFAFGTESKMGVAYGTNHVFSLALALGGPKRAYEELKLVDGFEFDDSIIEKLADIVIKEIDSYEKEEAITNLSWIISLLIKLKSSLYLEYAIDSLKLVCSDKADEVLSKLITEQKVIITDHIANEQSEEVKQASDVLGQLVLSRDGTVPAYAALKAVISEAFDSDKQKVMEKAIKSLKDFALPQGGAEASQELFSVVELALRLKNILAIGESVSAYVEIAQARQREQTEMGTISSCIRVLNFALNTDDLAIMSLAISIIHIISIDNFATIVKSSTLYIIKELMKKCEGETEEELKGCRVEVLIKVFNITTELHSMDREKRLNLAKPALEVITAQAKELGLTDILRQKLTEEKEVAEKSQKEIEVSLEQAEAEFLTAIENKDFAKLEQIIRQFFNEDFWRISNFELEEGEEIEAVLVKVKRYIKSLN